MGVVIVPELDDPGMPLECRLHDAALDAAAAPVNDADLAQAGGRSRVEVFVNHRGHVSGREGMKIELVLDRNSERLVSHGATSGVAVG
jgi:hypothetical protein